LITIISKMLIKIYIIPFFEFRKAIS